jgi:hypothetical protein
MMTSMRTISLALVMLVGCAGAAHPSTSLPSTVDTPRPSNAALPAALESLHPHCVAQLFFEREARVETAVCGAASGDVSIEGSWRNFFPGDGDDGREIEGYEWLGAYDQGFALRYLVNGGGTGNFTGVMVVALEGSELVRRADFTQGDRCNGGLEQATIEGDAILTRQSITPAELIEASEFGRGLHLVAYEHLEASASSCVAEVATRWVHGAPTRVVVTLSEAPVDQPGWTSNFAYQSCFNALVAARIEAGQRDLSPAELEAFAEAFAARCVQGSAAR